VGGHEPRTCPGQGTAGLELAGATQGVTTTKVEALEPRTQGEAGRGRGLLLRDRGKARAWLVTASNAVRVGLERNRHLPERDKLALKLWKPLWSLQDRRPPKIKPALQ
jgi:hypothetical protein